MLTATTRAQGLSFTQARTYLLATLFVGGNILLPQLCHLMPNGGLIWLPIYFFTLIGAYAYGWRVGLLTAIASPLINSMLFGMPSLAVLPAIMLKSCALAIIAGLVSQKVNKPNMLSVAADVLGYQTIGTIGEWAMAGDLMAALQDFRIGLPGILVQIFVGYALVRWIYTIR